MRAVLLAVALAGTAGAQADPSIAPLVAKIQKFYDATRDFHAHFKQDLLSGDGGGKKKGSGEVWLKKPGKMRWNYDKPERKLMISDGRTLWVYEPEDQQAFKQDLESSTLPVSVAFLFGRGKISEQFSVSIAHPEGIGSGGDVVLQLIPKQASASISKLYLAVDPKTGEVRESVIDQQGTINHLTFSDFQANRGVNDRDFKFSPPKGTTILGGGKPAPGAQPTPPRP